MRALLTLSLLVAGVSFGQTYAWTAGTYSACSAACGGGSQTRTVVCTATPGGVVADSFCLATSAKPPTSQSCNPQACTFSWLASAYSSCSLTCGGGTQVRSVTCINDATGMAVAETQCTTPKPATSQSCNTQACATFSWNTSAFSACSLTCGGGTQVRSVTCVDNTGATVAETLCTTPKPATSQNCNTQACATFSWNTTAFSACSLTCGGGSQVRSVTCVDNTGATVSETLCTPPKPATSQSCNTQACATFSWNTSAFSACSLTCGGGTQARSVTCVDNTGATVAETLCTTPKPTTSQSCNTQACATYGWTTGPFGQCDTACGGGSQTRAIFCTASTGQVVNASFCTSTPPTTSQSCNVQACASGTWVTSMFGACTVSCGGGTQTRAVVCADATGAVLPNSACTATAPPSSQSCNTNACTSTSWMSGAWSVCSASCGGGTQSRVVTCIDANGAPAAATACTTAVPPSQQTCNTQACAAGQWVAGTFGACSQSCGGGTQLRTVSCQSATGAVLPATACSGAVPAEMQTCNAQACAAGTWMSDAFGPCSEVCGGGMQERAVTCVDGSGAPLPESACVASPQPGVAQQCNTQACPAGQWLASTFGGCSESCGGGTQSRSVTCVDGNGEPLPGSACAGAAPATEQVCNTQACQLGHWNSSAWSECSVACGGGTQTRTVSCVDALNASVPASMCADVAPSSMQTCNASPCVANWETGEFSECACATQSQSRTVRCVANGIEVDEARCTTPKPAPEQTCGAPCPAKAPGCSSVGMDALAALVVLVLARRRRA